MNTKLKMKVIETQFNKIRRMVKKTVMKNFPS